MLRRPCPMAARGLVDHGSSPNTLAGCSPDYGGPRWGGINDVTPVVGPREQPGPLVGRALVPLGPVEVCPDRLAEKKSRRTQKISRMKPQQTGPKPASNWGDRRHTDGASPVVVKIRTIPPAPQFEHSTFLLSRPQPAARTKSTQRRCPGNLSSNRGFSSNILPTLFPNFIPTDTLSRRPLTPSRLSSPDLTTSPPGALPKEKSSAPDAPFARLHRTVRHQRSRPRRSNPTL